MCVNCFSFIILWIYFSFQKIYCPKMGLKFCSLVYELIFSWIYYLPKFHYSYGVKSLFTNRFFLLDIRGGRMWLWIISVRLLSRWFHEGRGPSFWRLRNCASTAMSFTSSCWALSQLHSNVVLWCRLWRLQSFLVWR